MLFQFLPRLANDEYAALEESIRDHGIQVPVVVDERGSIIDGHHRKEISERLGIECPQRIVEGLADDKKRTLALSLNLDRRHLSREQRRELLAASIKADPHLSDREHGRRTGTSHPTAAAVRSELESAGDVEELSTRLDSSGRQQPASRAAAAEAPGLPKFSDWMADNTQTPKPGEASTTSSPFSGSDERGEQNELPAVSPASVDLSDFINSDPTVRLTSWRKHFMAAIAKSSDLLLFTPDDVAENAGVDLINELERLASDLNNYVSRVRAKRPTHLTALRGGKQ